MKKNTIILILILLIIGILFIYKQNTNVELSINGKYINQNDIKIMNNIYKILYDTDNMDNSSILFYFLKRQIFLSFMERFGIKLNENELKQFEHSFNKEKIEKIKQLSGNKYKILFLLPEFAYSKLIYTLLTDTLNFQKQRYEKANEILKKWTDGYEDILTDNYIEYFRKNNIALNNDHIFIKEFDKKYINDDERYYYVYRQNKDYIEGFRIKKLSPDSILLKNKNLINIDFYNEELLRAINKLSQHSIWYNLIFNNDK